MTALQHYYLRFLDEQHAKTEMPWAYVEDGELITKGVDWDITNIVAPWETPPVHEDDPGTRMPGHWMLLLASDDKGLTAFVQHVGKRDDFVSYARDGDD